MPTAHRSGDCAEVTKSRDNDPCCERMLVWGVAKGENEPVKGVSNEPTRDLCQTPVLPHASPYLAHHRMLAWLYTLISYIRNIAWDFYAQRDRATECFSLEKRHCILSKKDGVPVLQEQTEASSDWHRCESLQKRNASKHFYSIHISPSQSIEYCALPQITDKLGLNTICLKMRQTRAGSTCSWKCLQGLNSPFFAHE